MTRHRLALPDRLESSRVRKLVDCARALVTLDDVEVDASSVLFAEPFGLVMLGAAVLRRLDVGLPIPGYVGPQRDEPRKFLEEIGFDQLMTTGVSTADSGTLPIRRLSANSLNPAYMHEVAQLVERLVPGTSESVTYLVEMALKELVQNVVEHSGSATDAVVLTRWYRQHENVRIAIADSGIGLARSVRRNPKYAAIEDDRILVRYAATVEGTTGRVGARFGGLGLKHLHQLCILRGGGLHVISRTVDASYTARDSREAFVPRLDGTVVEIDFRPRPDQGSRAEQTNEEEFF